MRPHCARGWAKLFLHTILAAGVIALSSATARGQARRGSLKGGDSLSRDRAPEELVRAHSLREDPAVLPQGSHWSLHEQVKHPAGQPRPAGPEAQGVIRRAGVEAAEMTAEELSRIETLPRRLDNYMRRHGIKHLLSGWEFNYRIFTFRVVFCSLSMAIAFGSFFICQGNRRSKGLRRWETAVTVNPPHSEEKLKPDTVMVFHYPEHDSRFNDAETNIPKSSVEHVILDCPTELVTHLRQYQTLGVDQRPNYEYVQSLLQSFVRTKRSWTKTYKAGCNRRLQTFVMT